MEGVFSFFTCSWQNPAAIINTQSCCFLRQLHPYRELVQHPAALHPLDEQHRIVARIEELFTNLDAGMESLKAAQAQLKRYRQSVLKSACEIRLVPTEAELARAEGWEYEPVVVLLERIKAEKAQMEKLKVERKVKHTME